MFKNKSVIDSENYGVGALDLICDVCGFRYGHHVGEMCPAPEPKKVIREVEETAVAPTQVGDINSDAKGSGARYNAGKPDISLIPFEILADIENTFVPETTPVDYVRALNCLGIFQFQHNRDALIHAAIALGFDWRTCAQVFEYGKKKYAAWNWSKGMAWSVPLACAGRHIMQMLGGEETDPESGLPHKGHVEANIIMLLYFLDHYKEGNDLPVRAK